MCLVPEFSDVSNTFEVTIKRNSLGLGFSIQGGPDAASPWTNLIRVKKVFPLQPAWETGNLKVGDIILKVSGRTSYRFCIKDRRKLAVSIPQEFPCHP